MEAEEDEDDPMEGQAGKKRRSRPDVAARNQRKKTLQESSVKMTLNKFCNDPDLQREIEGCVHGVTRTCIEASRFLNYYVLKLLKDENNIPKLDQSFFSSAFTSMATCKGQHKSVKEKFRPALDEYNNVRPPQMDKFDYSDVVQMLTYAAKEYMTACKNHVVLNISSRVSKAFKLFFDGLPQKFRAVDRNKARKYYMRRHSLECGPGHERAMWDSFNDQPTEETRAAVNDYIKAHLERYASLPLDVDGLNPTEKVAPRWWEYLRWLYDLQKEMQPYATRHFSILPLCSFTAKHVTIDGTSLRGLLLRMSRRTGRAAPEDVKTFLQNQDQHWNRYFRLSKAEGQNHRRGFEKFLKTDGYAVSVLLSKVKIVPANVPAVPAISLEGKRVVGVDPGRIDLASCAWEKPDGSAAFSHYSNKEYCTNTSRRSV